MKALFNMSCVQHVSCFLCGQLGGNVTMLHNACLEDTSLEDSCSTFILFKQNLAVRFIGYHFLVLGKYIFL